MAAEKVEKRVYRLLHIPSLVLTTTVSIALFCLRDHNFAGKLPELVSNNRDVSGIIVQVSASVLAVAQVYVLTKLVNFAARIHIFKNYVSSNSLGLFTALSGPRLNWSLHWYQQVGVMLFVFLGPILGASWAGALTPLTTVSLRQDGTMQVPHYTGPFTADWSLSPGGTLYLNNCSSLLNSEFVGISKCPAVSYITSLLASAYSATSPSGTARQHAKFEDSSWTYSGRSYGVGATQGLFLPSNSSKDAYTSYSYDEIGYWSNVSCMYNATSNLTISPATTVPHLPVVLWTVEGTLPNTVSTNTSSYTLSTANTLWSNEVLGWLAAASNDQNLLAIATYLGGHWYTYFSRIQCSVTFTPTQFTVSVTTNLSLIEVVPTGPAQDFEPTGSLKTIVMDSLDLISRISSNIGISSLGNALEGSVAAVTANHPELSSNETTLLGVENAIVALIDDLLVAQSNAQMIIEHSTSRAVVMKHFKAVKIGATRFIDITLVVNILLILLVLAEAVRTRIWHRLPAFNLTDIQSVISSALLSDIKVTRSIDDMHDGENTALISAADIEKATFKWTYDADGSAVMMVQPLDGGSQLLQHDSDSNMDMDHLRTSKTTSIQSDEFL